MYSSVDELLTACQTVATIENDEITLTNETLLRESFIDVLLFTGLFGEDQPTKEKAKNLIRQLAKATGVIPTSLSSFLADMGTGKINGITLPAFTVSTLDYDFARIVFQHMQRKAIGPVIFALSQTEAQATGQNLDEFSVSILAAAIKERYSGPLFLQADAYPLENPTYQENKEGAIDQIKKYIAEAILAHIYNIEIDASPLVDLTQETVAAQQAENSEVTAALTQIVRDLQPHDTMIALGAHLSPVQQKSTPEAFESFMSQYRQKIPQNGFSTICIQAGTTPGGLVQSDGTFAEMTLDIALLSTMGKTARETYRLAGVSLHGTSTLPLTVFSQFPENYTAIIHLSTLFQTRLFETMPRPLYSHMMEWVKTNCQHEKKPEWSDDQFLISLRKKALGPFKKQLWALSEAEKQPIFEQWEKELNTVFEALHLSNTRSLIVPNEPVAESSPLLSPQDPSPFVT